MRFKKIKSQFVGLDIGEGTIKLAVISSTPAGAHLVDYAIKEIPRDRGEKGIVETLKNLFLDMKLDGSNVVVLLSSPRLFIRRIHIPHMKKEELVEAAKWEAKEHMPFPVDKASIDFLPVGEVEEHGTKKIDGIVAASEDSEVEKSLSLLSQAGITPQVLGILPMALWNGIRGMKLEEKVVSIISLGEKDTHISIFREGKLELCRDIAGGRDTFVESLIGETISDEGKIVIDGSEAQKIVQEYGLVQDDATGLTYNKIPLAKIGVLMRPVAENLLTEIGRFFDYYRETHPGDKIEKIILSGEGTNLKNLPGFLTKSLATPVVMADPLKELEYPTGQAERLKDFSPRLTIAIGLALGKGEGINLLPGAIKTEKSRKVKKLSIEIVAGTIFLILAIIYLGLFMEQKVYERRLSRLNAEWETLSPQQIEFIKLTEEKKTIDQTLFSFQRIAGRKMLWSGILKEIGNIIPESAFLQDVFLKEKNNIILRGIITEDKRGAQVGLADFMSDLERSPFFKNVSMVSSVENSEYKGTLNFELNMELE